jgi:hypothetical protein
MASTDIYTIDPIASLSNTFDPTTTVTPFFDPFLG